MIRFSVPLIRTPNIHVILLLSILYRKWNVQNYSWAATSLTATERHAPPPLWSRTGKKRSKKSHLIIRFPMSSGVSKWESTQVNAAERANEANSVWQAFEWTVQANEQTNEQVAQYINLDSWLFLTIVASFISRFSPSLPYTHTRHESKEIQDKILTYYSKIDKKHLHLLSAIATVCPSLYARVVILSVATWKLFQ